MHKRYCDMFVNKQTILLLSLIRFVYCICVKLTRVFVYFLQILTSVVPVLRVAVATRNVSTLLVPTCVLPYVSVVLSDQKTARHV